MQEAREQDVSGQEAADSEDEQVHAYIKWHLMLGKSFDLVVSRMGLEVKSEDPTSTEPPRVDVVILRRYTSEWTAEQYAVLPDGIRHSKASHILIEHKQTESINLSVFKQAFVYQELYPSGHHVGEKEVETFILSAKTPQKKSLQEAGYHKTDIAGVYESDNVLLTKVKLIVLNGLQPSDNNAFVQCFASRRRVREAAFARLMKLGWLEMSVEFWHFLLGLRQEWEKKGGEMSVVKEKRIVTPEMLIARGREIRHQWIANLTIEELAIIPPEKRAAWLANLSIEEFALISPEKRAAWLLHLTEEDLATLPLEKRLAGLSPEQRLAGLEPEQRLAGLEPEQRLAGLEPEQRLAGITPDEIPILLAQIEAMLHQQPLSPKPQPHNSQSPEPKLFKTHRVNRRKKK